jgi:FkbM family methyltransferase
MRQPAQELLTWTVPVMNAFDAALTLIEPGLAWFGRRWGYRRGARFVSALRQRRARFYQGRPEAWVTIRDYDRDLSISIDRSAYIGSLIYWHGGQGTHEFKLLKHLLRPEMVVLDVGANQGEATLLVAKRVGRGNVLAFEPVPALYAQLQRNIALNQFQNVVALPCALAAQPGLMPMYTSMDVDIHASWNEGLASLYRSGYRDTPTGEVQVDTLDAVVARLNLQRVDVIKIDVEGAEPQVVRGGLETLKHYRPKLVMEINPSALADAGSSPGALVELLHPLGYQFSIIESGGQARLATSDELDQNCDVLVEIR